MHTDSHAPRFPAFTFMKIIPLLAFALLHAFTAVQAAGEDKGSQIPFSEIGARATADYRGDAIGITATADGAALRTGFQKLAATVTRAGLRLESTAEKGGGLHLIAASLGRTGAKVELATTGEVTVGKESALFNRPGLTEVYSVSVDGVRQDFIVAARPGGTGKLIVELALNGARAEKTAEGATLVLADSGRALSYSSLRVIDAANRELPARLEVLSPTRLAIEVEDTQAVYPVRIDPTFSDANWTSLNPGIPGANGPVYAAVVDRSGNLYIGGQFTFVGTVAATNIAKWDGSTWSALGAATFDDTPGASVNVLVTSGSDLYVGGFFAQMGGVAANRIAKWDGVNWSALGSGMDGNVFALATNGTDLYAGGLFNTAGGVAANRIAKWNGSAWSALGAGMSSANPQTYRYVATLAILGTDLYAGGLFTSAGGRTVNHIAKWDGTSWWPLGSGLDQPAGASVVAGSDLIVGGQFTTAGGASANYIAKWDGSAWSALGSGMDGNVSTLAFSGKTLYAGGDFTMAGDVAAPFVAKWNGKTWSGMGKGTDSGILALAASGADLFAAGGFTQAGGKPARFVAKWSRGNWSALGSGIDDVVHALAVIGTDLYAGGFFTTVGGVAANYVAKWDGRRWSPLGSGLDDGVDALAVIGRNLYAGGRFTMAGGVASNHIARWNGVAWSALDSGTDAPVLALAVIGGDLYAGGLFGSAGDVDATYIAKWNGREWSALGAGIRGNSGSFPHVSALAAIGTDLYAGGRFSSAGNVGARHIAKWDGNAWSALGAGMDDDVAALTASGTDLYAGGSFTTADGVAAAHVAKWNGSAWSPLGSGIPAHVVYSLTMIGQDLYAGGEFAAAGGQEASNIAKWNGSDWSPLGSGMDGIVRALAADASGRLFAGGDFHFAGGTLSPFVSRANFPWDADIAVQSSGVALATGDTRAFRLVPPRISLTRNFTVFNRGGADLTGLAITLDGEDSDDFAVVASPAASVGPGGRTTFRVRFKPSTRGEKTAVLRIANNVPGKDPFVIHLTGDRPLPNRR